MSDEITVKVVLEDGPYDMALSIPDARALAVQLLLAIDASENLQNGRRGPIRLIDTPNLPPISLGFK